MCRCSDPDDSRYACDCHLLDDVNVEETPEDWGENWPEQPTADDLANSIAINSASYFNLTDEQEDDLRRIAFDILVEYMPS